MREANGYVWQQVFQAVRPGSKNDNSDASASQILLVFDALIHGEKNVKLGGFGGYEQLAILESGQSGVTGFACATFKPT